MVKIRVVIVDDDALVRAGLKMMLGGEASPLEVVGDVADGSEAVALVEEYRPDVVLMDIRMPKMDGIEATKRVLALPEPPKVVMLTTFNTDDLVLGALQAGAHGFLHTEEVMGSSPVSPTTQNPRKHADLALRGFRHF